jgi:hypothetical protein
MTTDQVVLERLLERRLEANVSNDREALSQLLHDHYCYVTSFGMTYDKDRFLDAFAGGGEKKISTKPVIVGMRVDRDVATITSNIFGTFSLDGRLHHGLYHTTHTLIKLNGVWMFLAGHYYEHEMHTLSPLIPRVAPAVQSALLLH